MAISPFPSLVALVVSAVAHGVLDYVNAACEDRAFDDPEAMVRLRLKVAWARVGCLAYDFLALMPLLHWRPGLVSSAIASNVLYLAFALMKARAYRRRRGFRLVSALQSIAASLVHTTKLVAWWSIALGGP